MLRKDAEFQWELQQIQGAGPSWKDGIQPGSEGVAGIEGGVAAGQPPEFGGTAPAEGGGEEAGTEEPGGEETSPEPAV